MKLVKYMILAVVLTAFSTFAAEGEALFKAKFCNTCHTIGKGKLVGPDLKGVTARREKDWILKQIIDPAEMAKSDPVAKKLVAEYGIAMMNVGAKPTKEEADKLYQYLKSQE